MANVYTYSFNGTLPRTSTSGGGAESVSINGVFTVDYTDANPRIYNVNVTANGSRTSDGQIFQRTNLDGTNTYVANFNLFTSIANTQTLDVTYIGREPIDFSNTRYQQVGLGSFAYTYTSQNVQVASQPISNPVCFAAGTGIRVARDGHTMTVAVEQLRVGDLVLTASGEQRPIVWLGHRTIDCARHPRPEAVWPIRILPNAFGEGLPDRELWLSPDHAVQVAVLDPVLIPVKHLINDATVAQVPLTKVTYWHVELESHDILLADNMPAESFLDTGVREFFAKEGGFTPLHPDFSPLSLDDFCLPLVQVGPIVDAVRTRLNARAVALGWSLTSEDNLHVVADGVEIGPERDGALVRFSLPADSREVRLVSRTFVPERVRVGAGDGRRLGVLVRAVSVIDGHGVARSLPVSSDLLATGFSFVQDGAWRWTTGDAVLPSALWAGCEGAVTLVVETAPECGTLSAWLAPPAQVEHAAALAA